MLRFQENIGTVDWLKIAPMYRVSGRQWIGYKSIFKKKTEKFYNVQHHEFRGSGLLQAAEDTKYMNWNLKTFASRVWINVRKNQNTDFSIVFAKI